MSLWVVPIIVIHSDARSSSQFPQCPLTRAAHLKAYALIVLRCGEIILRDFCEWTMGLCLVPIIVVHSGADSLFFFLFPTSRVKYCLLIKFWKKSATFYNFVMKALLNHLGNLYFSSLHNDGWRQISLTYSLSITRIFPSLRYHFRLINTISACRTRGLHFAWQ